MGFMMRFVRFAFGWQAAVVALAGSFVPWARAELVPNNDPYFADSWHHAAINSPAAWAITTGSAAVRVAVLDAGVYAAHPDLAGRVLTGWNVLTSTSDTSAATTHGTAVAGILGAGLNNGLGVAGMGNFAIVPVKMTTGGSVFSTDAVAALNWVAEHAAEQNIRVALMSYYLRASTAGYLAAVAHVQQAGVLLVESVPNVQPPFFRADYVPDEVPGVVQVAGTDHNNLLRSGTGASTTGAAVELVAPSVDIYTTYYDPSGADPSLYKVALSGNSWAAPQVAGAAALMWSVNPELTINEVRDILYATAQDLGAEGRDNVYGYGLLDAGAAVAEAARLANAPEPSTLVLLAAGLLGLVCYAWRKRK